MLRQWYMQWCEFFYAEAAAMMKKCLHIYLSAAKLGRLVYHIQATSVDARNVHLWAKYLQSYNFVNDATILYFSYPNFVLSNYNFLNDATMLYFSYLLCTFLINFVLFLP